MVLSVFSIVFIPPAVGGGRRVLALNFIRIHLLKNAMQLSLDQALGQLDISTSTFDRVAVTGPWSPHAADAGGVQFIVILRGAGSFSLGDKMQPVRAGQLWVMEGRAAPLFVAARPFADDDGLLVASATFSANLLDGRSIFDFIAMPYTYDAGNSELFVSAIPELLQESAHGGAGSAAIVTCLMRRIVTLLVRQGWPEATLIPAARLGAQTQRLQQVVDLMRKDPARNYTLDSLCSAAGMSRTVFHKSFTAAYGRSPLVLLREMRLKKAEELLTQTDLPIKTIAARLGYRSRSYFWSAFKQAYGSDPDSYRNQGGSGSCLRG
jgi:AraC-like DNA-binding protein